MEVKLFRLLFAFFILNALIDPIVVLWIVKPYHKATLCWIRGLRRCSCTITGDIAADRSVALSSVKKEYKLDDEFNQENTCPDAGITRTNDKSDTKLIE